MRYVDKGVLKKNLPIAYACARLGINLDEHGVGLCPFHNDTKPSFRLWESDDGDQRFHCFPCGAGGDVFDLIQRIEGVDFPDSIKRAEEFYDELPRNWEAPRITVQTDPSPEWDSIVARARDRVADQDGWLCVGAGLADESMSQSARTRIDEFLRDGLGWGVDERGNIVIPHWDADGTLVGIKMRSISGRKWSLSGSSYKRSLYGAWRTQRHRTVLVTEGESDMAWAILQRPAADVLSLPGGASNFQEDWVRYVRESYDEVYIAFDADTAGVVATRTWIEALRGENVRVCRLPSGHDLRSAKPDLDLLMQEAVKPKTILPGVAVLDDSFVRQQKDGSPRPITTWLLDPKANLRSLDDDTEHALEVNIHSQGQVRNDIIELSAFVSGNKFKSWAKDRALDYAITDQDVALVQSLLLAQATLMPEVFQSARAGLRTPPPEYQYAGRTLVYPGGFMGKLPWRYVGKDEKLAEGIHVDDDGPFNWNWFKSVLQLNEPGVIQPILAWLAAAARRTEVRHFPLLYVGGPSGSGKTTTTQLLCRMFGSSVDESLASITPFALLKHLMRTTTLPVFIDEWTLASRHDALMMMKSAIPALYEGGTVARGRTDLSVTELRLSSPTIIAGEDTFRLDREIERMVTVQLNRTQHNADALARVGEVPLERFAHWFYEWLINTPQDELPPMPRVARDRPTYNKEILIAGWQTLLAFINSDPEAAAVVGELPSVPDLEIVEQVFEDHENEYEVMVRECLTINDAQGQPLAWSDPGGRGTWVRFRPMMAPAVRSRIEVDLPGGSRAMKNYFKQRYELLDRKVVIPFTANKWSSATLIVGFHADDIEEDDLPPMTVKENHPPV